MPFMQQGREMFEPPALVADRQSVGAKVIACLEQCSGQVADELPGSNCANPVPAEWRAIDSEAFHCEASVDEMSLK